MLKSLMITLVALMMSAAAYGASWNINGDWDGELHPGAVKLRLTFHIETIAGAVRGTMISVDQGNASIPISSVSCNGSDVTITVAKVGGTYHGALAEDGKSIAGSWQQRGANLPLTLNRRASGQVGFNLRRPQEPHPPFPYHTEDVVFGGPGGNELAGTITIPDGAGTFPAVLLVQGSGPHDRDESTMGHKPFMVIADYLTRHGIATLRVDKRGYAKSTGNYAAATTLDFAADAEAAGAYLKSRPEIDHAKIGLAGHSEGGMIAPIVAAKDHSIAFIVLIEAPGVPGDELLMLQKRYILHAMGLPEEKIELNLDRQKKLLAAVKPAKNSEDARARVKAALDVNSQSALASQVNLVSSPWYLFTLNYDPAIYLRQVRCPVLAIAGGKDLQVPPKEDLAGIKAALAKNRDAQTVELPGLNHLLQPTKTGLPSEYGEIEETIAPIALETITSWIVQHTR